MKLFKKIILATVVAILAAVVCFISIVVYHEEFKKKEVYRQTSPDGEYTVVLYQVGQPEWPFGAVKAEIRLLNANRKTLDQESIEIHTDGGQLHGFFVEEVRWCDEAVEFECTQADGLDAITCELEFD